MSVALPFGPNSALLDVVQAACVALPAAGLPVWLARARGRGWALVAPLSIAVCVGLIAAVPSSARAYTWLALIGVPLGCALWLGWAGHGARPVLAPLAGALLAVVWIWPDTTGGDWARVVLICGSAATIGRLLAGACAPILLKAGLVAMAVVDAILVFGNQLQAPNAVLNAAVPAAGLPQLQTLHVGTASLGYGDVFAAAVLGAVLAAEGRHQWPAALGLLAAGLAFDLLFVWFDTLPATVPVAVVLLVVELSRRVPRAASGSPSPGLPRPWRSRARPS